MSRIGLSVLLAIAETAPLASTAPAAIKIAKIRFDPAGADTGSNTSLKVEWDHPRNTGNSTRQLSGWRVRDRSGHGQAQTRPDHLALAEAPGHSHSHP
jgi:hypothetical protein